MAASGTQSRLKRPEVTVSAVSDTTPPAFSPDDCSGGAFSGGVWRAGRPAPPDSLLLEDSPHPRLIVCREGREPTETVLVVPPLAPGPARELLLSEARRRGAEPQGSDPALEALVEATQGLPLVVRLAAAQLCALSPGTVIAMASDAAHDLLYDHVRRQR